MRVRLVDILVSVMAFIFIFYLYVMVSFVGIQRFIAPGPLPDYMAKGVWHLEVIIQGTVFGVLFVIINALTESHLIRRRSFGFHILLKSALYAGALALGALVIAASFIGFGLVTPAEIEVYFGILSSEFLFALALYLGFFVILMNFLVQINKKFGPGGLWNLVSGKYHQPRDENLIFLFLDLRSSTHLAETLGHQTYSKFLKDCIHELTPIIQRNRAKVHQYVGDEVVLFWRRKDGKYNSRCLNTYFEFRRRLRQLDTYFNKTYGAVPEFKAGMDAGEVTITEIGDIKREIAYHGDVVNTASRLEKKCNEFGQDFLISENLVDYLGPGNGFDYRFMSDLPLRGKSKNLKFYAVAQP